MKNSAIDACYRYVAGSIRKIRINKEATVSRINIQSLRVLVVFLFALICLPAAAAEPEGSFQPLAQTNPVDALAAKLAEKVLKGGKAGEAALKEALTAAGFTILRAKDKKVLSRPKKNANQGLAFDEWEIYIMNRAARDSVQVPSSDVALMIVHSLPELKLKTAPIQKLLVQDIQARAKDKHPGLRLWARFIVELGRRSEQPYDLLGKFTLGKVQFDTIQSALILRRLGGDFQAIARRDTKDSLKFAPATVSALDGPELKESVSKTPCSFNSTESVIMDGAALTATEGFKQLMKYLGTHGMKLAGKIAGRLTPANLILGALKLIISYAAMEVDVRLEPKPLERTTSTSQHGRSGKLITKVIMDYPKILNWANCARIVLNSIGLDFNLPNHGPMEDVGVEMVPRAGFGDGGFVKFWGDHTPTRRWTEKDGKTWFSIEGQKQRHELPQHVIQVERTASVDAQVTLKRKMSFVDVLDSVLTPLSIPLKLIEMNSWITNAHYTFPIIDWMPGEFHVEGTNQYNLKGPSGYDMTITTTSASGDIQLVPTARTSDHDFDIEGKGMAEWQITGTTRVNVAETCTVNAIGTSPITFWGSGAVEERTYHSIPQPDGTFFEYSGVISFHTPQFTLVHAKCRGPGGEQEEEYRVVFASAPVPFRFIEGELNAGKSFNGSLGKDFGNGSLTVTTDLTISPSN